MSRKSFKGMSIQRSGVVALRNFLREAILDEDFIAADAISAEIQGRPDKHFIQYLASAARG